MTAIRDNPSSAPTAPPRSRKSAGWWLRAIIVLAVLIAGGWYATAQFPRWKDRFVPRRLRTVDEGQIYASGQIDRHLIRGVLTDKKIKVVVMLLGEDRTDPDVQAEIAASKDLNIERYAYRLSGDGTGDIHMYADAVAKMVECEKEHKPLLIHCSSGVQRSNGATFFYRVLVQHHTADDAVAEIERNGFNPRANTQMLPYLNAHMGEMAELLRERSVIDQVPSPLPRIHL